MTANPTADRWRRVSTDFAGVIDAVPSDRWDAPTPCEGWVARDVVGHLVEWVPPFLSAGAPLDIPDGADRDAVDAWTAIAAAIQPVLDSPATATATFDHPMAGSHGLADAIDRFVTFDVLVHTWDLATATGQEVVLDDEATAAFLTGFAEVDEEMLVASGQFGPRVSVPDDATAQIRLLALTGREA